METYIEKHRLKMLRHIKENSAVYVVPMDPRCSPFTAEILSIGRKYITVSNIYKGDNKFTLTDFENICSDDIPKYEIYATEQDYELRITIDELQMEIRKRLPYLSTDTLQKIFEIADNNLE